MAEIFGTEIIQNIDYEFFGGTNAAVFTWHGCEIEVTGQCLSEYIASETPMSSYLNTHLALDNLRQQASQLGGGYTLQGPRVSTI